MPSLLLRYSAPCSGVKCLERPPLPAIRSFNIGRDSSTAVETYWTACNCAKVAGLDVCIPYSVPCRMPVNNWAIRPLRDHAFRLNVGRAEFAHVDRRSIAGWLGGLQPILRFPQSNTDPATRGLGGASYIGPIYTDLTISRTERP